MKRIPVSPFPVRRDTARQRPHFDDFSFYAGRQFVSKHSTATGKEEITVPGGEPRAWSRDPRVNGDCRIL